MRRSNASGSSSAIMPRPTSISRRSRSWSSCSIPAVSEVSDQCYLRVTAPANGKACKGWRFRERWLTQAPLAQWTERPALVRTAAGWRMLVGCATPGTKHWWIAAAEANTLEGLAAAEIRTAFAGDAQTGVKDPIVRVPDGVWHAWICCHPLDIPDAEDRMSTAYATSADGWNWDWRGT